MLATITPIFLVAPVHQLLHTGFILDPEQLPGLRPGVAMDQAQTYRLTLLLTQAPFSRLMNRCSFA